MSIARFSILLVFVFQIAFSGSSASASESRQFKLASNDLQEPPTLKSAKTAQITIDNVFHGVYSPPGNCNDRQFLLRVDAQGYSENDLECKLTGISSDTHGVWYKFSCSRDEKYETEILNGIWEIGQYNDKEHLFVHQGGETKFSLKCE